MGTRIVVGFAGVPTAVEYGENLLNARARYTGKYPVHMVTVAPTKVLQPGYLRQMAFYNPPNICLVANWTEWEGCREKSRPLAKDIEIGAA